MSAPVFCVRPKKGGFLVRKGLYVFGGLAAAYAVVMALRSNVNFGNLAMLLLGGACLAAGVWYTALVQFLHTRVGRAAGVFICVCAAAALGILGYIGVCGHRVTADFTEDAVVVLGAGVRGDQVTRTLQRRLDTALDYAAKNPAALVVVSGGQGPQETVTEASAMRDYLTAHGLPAERIVAEEQATSTLENFMYSKRLLDERLGSGYRIAYVTNHFHAYRAGQLAKQAGLDAASYPAGLDWYLAPINYIRELFAVGQLWLLKK